MQRAGVQYDRAARRAAAAVIAEYSTSFGLATRLCRGPVRERIRCVYAMVRVADEIVDGVAEDAGLDAEQTRLALDAYEREVDRAVASGFSADLVVHAFAGAARASGIDKELTAPFFASMRADLDRAIHSEQSFGTYVYGSAEVVGLMCLKIFVTDTSAMPVDPEPHLREGARRLGAAFQKVNFLRDLGDDFDERGRSYFPGIAPDRLTAADFEALLDDIDADLASAASVIDDLPASSRRAVWAAHNLFAELSRRIRATPPAHLRRTRVRVPGPRKAWILARGLAVRAEAGR